MDDVHFSSAEIRRDASELRRFLRQEDKARRRARRAQIRRILDEESSDDRFTSEDALDNTFAEKEQLDARRPGPKPPPGKPPQRLLQAAGKTQVACSKQPGTAWLASGSVFQKVAANCKVEQPCSRSPMYRTGVEQSRTGERGAAASGSAGKAEVLHSTAAQRQCRPDSSCKRSGGATTSPPPKRHRKHHGRGCGG